MSTDRQTDRQDRQDRQTDRQDRQTDRQMLYHDNSSSSVIGPDELTYCITF